MTCPAHPFGAPTGLCCVVTTTEPHSHVYVASYVDAEPGSEQI